MKKILALCLTVMLVLAMVPVIGASAATAALFTVDAVEGAVGEEVTVTISIAENPGLTSAQVKVAYDAAAFEIVEKGIVGLTFEGTKTAVSPTTANPASVTWCDALNDTTATGAIATITFKIKEDATPGVYELKVTSDQANVFDTAMNDVPFDTQNGSIKVICKHTETELVGAKEATCKEAGYTGDEVCKACGETVKDGKVIDKLPHTEVVEGAVAADCVTAGSTGTTKCSVCGETIKAAEVIDALGHTEELVGAKAATCEDDGYTGDKVCTVCEEVLEKGEVIPALGHDIIKVEAVEPTCTDEGNVEHFACSVCGTTYADEDGAEVIDDVVIEALGHDYADGKCTVCGEEEKKEEDKPAEENKPADKPAEKPNTDNGDKAPATGDVANIFVVVSMLMAIAAAAVVVLKKKA